MIGELIGIGVGCGDPEMLSLAAVNCIRNSDLILLPRKEKEKCRAYQIALAAVPETEEKEILCFEFDMISDKELLQKLHLEIYENIKEHLESGKAVSFLTIGDPTVYSTFSYISTLAQKDGFRVKIINGIPSFCACAARLGISLAEGNSPIHIIPDFKEYEYMMAFPGTKIIMKCSGCASELKSTFERLEKESAKKGLRTDVYAVSDCGLPQEKVYYGIEQIPDKPPYMMTVIVKESVENQ